MLTPSRIRTRSTSGIWGVFAGVTRVVPALVAFVLLVDVAVAGGHFVYCASMDTVMSHACCAHHADDSPSPTSVLSARMTCCQVRDIGSLDQANTTSRSAEHVAPAIAYTSMIWLDAFSRFPSLGRLRRDPIVRAPPRSLALARRVVMQV